MNWEVLKIWAEQLLPFLLGGGAVYLINWLKNTFNIPSVPWLLGVNARAWLTGGVALVVALVFHFVSGSFDPGTLTWLNLVETLIAVAVSATAYYKKFVEEGGTVESTLQDDGLVI